MVEEEVEEIWKKVQEAGENKKAVQAKKGGGPPDDSKVVAQKRTNLFEISTTTSI